MIRWLDHPEYVEFMKNYIPGHQESEIRDAFNEKFGIVLTSSQIGCFKSFHHIKSGTNGGRFTIGMIPHNKGKKMPPEVYEKTKATMFKKGEMPPQYRPVGSERTGADGYVMVKVADPNKWRLKQRVVYEEYYGVELKKNEVVIFLDGDRSNFSIDNLEKLTRAELVRYNQDHNYCDNPEISKTAVLIAKLKTKMGGNNGAD